MGEGAVQYSPGQQLPGTVYRVVRHLATGGMGSVYDVEDVTVGKRYVLKTLHPQLVSRHDLAKRMQAEARTLAKLQHPNIVDVVTAGLTTDDKRMPFYVMERLVGQNLRDLIEAKGSLELAHCYRIAADVLDALEHAHENAVIHRDVKPENIFLHCSANGTTNTKLLDFGIMRLLDQKASHTQGKFIGTLRYASPEQIFGGDLGPATDIYSLGVVLYEMICGRGPFDDLGDAYAIGAAHAQRPPPLVSQFAPSVPPALERLVMSALAKAPEARPRDCFSFAGALRRMQREEEASPRSTTAINVLGSALPLMAVGGSLPATERSSATATGGPHEHPATEVGMPEHAGLTVPGAAMPATVRDVAGASTERAATDLAVAATVASEAARDAGLAVADAAVAPGHRARAAVDRAAETRASGLSGFTQRLAANGTAMDMGGPLPDGSELPGVVASRPEPVGAPRSSSVPSTSPRHDLVVSRTASYPNATGPLAGEAATRPPEPSMLLPLLAAAALGALLVGGVVLYVTKPWVGRAAAGAASTSATVPEALASALPAPEVEQGAPPRASAPALSAASPAAAASTDAGIPSSPAARAASAPSVAAPSVSSVVIPSAAPRKGPRSPRSGTPRPEDVGFD